MSGRRESPVSLAGLGVVALAVCCGLPLLVSAGVLAGLAIWLMGGGLLAVVVVAGMVSALAGARRRRRATDAPPVREE